MPSLRALTRLRAAPAATATGVLVLTLLGAFPASAAPGPGAPDGSQVVEAGPGEAPPAPAPAPAPVDAAASTPDSVPDVRPQFEEEEPAGWELIAGPAAVPDVDVTSPADPHPITVAYVELGGADGPLGAETGVMRCGLRESGCLQEFEGGSIYWTIGTGARAVALDFLDRWGQLGWELGYFGYPVTDEICGLRDGGCVQEFQGGSIVWSPDTGVRAVDGDIEARWADLGWEESYFGYPVSDARCGLRHGGCLQLFQGGSIYWTAFTGARAVDGAIRDTWGAKGWELGYFGYPIADARCGLRDGGCLQLFQGGSVYWSPATGAAAVDGAIRDTWASKGWEIGYFGYPTANARCGLRDGGCLQLFQGGSIYWSPATGAQAVDGQIRARWGQVGWELGFLGYPVAGARCGLRAGGCLQQFQGGAIYWSPVTRYAFEVTGPIRDQWAARGWEAGFLGYPLGPMTVTHSLERLPTMYSQVFQGGSLSVRGGNVWVMPR